MRLRWWLVGAGFQIYFCQFPESTLFDITIIQCLLKTKGKGTGWKKKTITSSIEHKTGKISSVCGVIQSFCN